MSRLVLAGACVLLTACMGLNEVRPVAEGAVPDENASLAVLSVRLEGALHTPTFSFALDEYDVERERIDGGCRRFNRIEVVADPTNGAVQYFAFSVPPGHYVYSGFNAVSISTVDNLFFVPEGRITYLGEFVYTAPRTIELRRDLEAARAYIGARWPQSNRNLEMAEIATAQNGLVFVCAP